MIEFRLQIDSRVTRAVVPLIVQCFSASGKKANASYPYFDEDDSDLTDSWEISLKEDFAKDRQSLARLLNEFKTNKSISSTNRAGHGKSQERQGGREEAPETAGGSGCKAGEGVDQGSI